MNDNSALNVPLVGSVLSRLASQTINNQPQQIARPITEQLIKEYNNELKEKEELIKNFEIVSKELIVMGFSPKLVLHSFLVYKYKTTEEGIELISKTSENLHTHRYIASDESRCFICDDVEDNHRNINRISIIKIDKNIPNLQSLIEKKKSVEFKKKDEKTIKFNLNSCPICFFEINEKDNSFNLDCMHIYCKECIIEFLKEEIKNARVQNIKCPTKKCDKTFTESTVKSLVNEETFYKYKKFLLRNKIKDDPNLIECPIQDCEGFAKKNLDVEHEELAIELPGMGNNSSEEDLNKKLVTKKKYTCSQGHNFCSNCNQAWHGDESCDKDKEIKDFATFSGIIVKKCPNCKVWTEKNEGCNHMTCKICSYSWCWICENECPPEHYFVEGTPCYGRQFNHQTDPEDARFAMMMNTNSILMNLFFCYILSFMITDMTVRSTLRHNNRNNPGEINQPDLENNQNQNLLNNENGHRHHRNAQQSGKLAIFVALTCLNIVFLILLLITNGFVALTMIANLRNLNRIRDECSKIVIVFTFIILYFTLFLTGGPILSVIWFAVSVLYSLIKIIIV